jgi:hypothetical protein
MFGQVQQHSGVVGLVAQGLAQQGLGRLGVGCFGGFQSDLLGVRDLRAQVLVQELPDLPLRLRAHELVHGPASDEQHHQRNAADLQRGRDLRRLVGVELGQHEATAIGLHQLLQHGLQVAAGAAPGRPAVQQHRHLERALEHGLAEVGLGDVEGQVLRRRGGGQVRVGGEHR